MTSPLFAYQMCKNDCTQGQLKYLNVINTGIINCMSNKENEFYLSIPAIEDADISLEKDNEYLKPVFAWLRMANLSTSFYNIDYSVDFYSETSEAAPYGSWIVNIFVKPSEA